MDHPGLLPHMKGFIGNYFFIPSSVKSSHHKTKPNYTVFRHYYFLSPNTKLSIRTNMSSNKKKLVMNTVSVSLGCSSCSKLKLSSFFNPKRPKLKLKLKPKPNSHSLYNNYSSSSSSTKKTTTTAATQRSLSEYETGNSFSPTTDWDMEEDIDKCSIATVRGFGPVGGGSLAVEKDSDDPYLDFRQSMLQMIVEKEIYSKNDLKELLNCFLQLNSLYHHGSIVRAFTEIWNEVFSGAGPSTKLHFGFRPRDL